MRDITGAESCRLLLPRPLIYLPASHCTAHTMHACTPLTNLPALLPDPTVVHRCLASGLIGDARLRQLSRRAG